MFKDWLKCFLKGHKMMEIENHHMFVRKYQCLRCGKFFAGITFYECGSKYFRYVPWESKWQHEADQFDRMFDKYGE